DDSTLLDVAGFGEGIALQLLDAKGDALLLDVDIEDDDLDHVALLVVLDRLLARTVPVEIGEMDHAVNVAFEAEEEAELGLVLDFALDGGADRMLLGEGFPRIGKRLFEAERNAALDRVDFEDRDFHFLRGGDDLARMQVLLRPGHFRDVHQALDAGLELHERTVVGDVGDAARDLGTDRIFRLDAFPRIALQL